MLQTHLSANFFLTLSLKPRNSEGGGWLSRCPSLEFFFWLKIQDFVSGLIGVMLVAWFSKIQNVLN